MNQTERLTAHLIEHKTINPLQAWSTLGIYRLSDTIYRLRKAGYGIVTNQLEVTNQFGEKCVVGEYELVSLP